MPRRPYERIFNGEIELDSLQTDEPIMNIKMRMAVQASEQLSRNISVYDFVLAIADSNDCKLVNLIDDEVVTTFRQLE